MWYCEHCHNFSVHVTNRCSRDLLTQSLLGKNIFAHLPLYFTLSPWRCLIRWKWNTSIINIKVLFFSVSWRVITMDTTKQSCDIYYRGKHPAVLHVSIHHQNCLKKKKNILYHKGDKLSQTRMCSGSWQALLKEKVATCNFNTESV